jgi:hypothetical protein
MSSVSKVPASTPEVDLSAYYEILQSVYLQIESAEEINKILSDKILELGSKLEDLDLRSKAITAQDIKNAYYSKCKEIDNNRFQLKELELEITEISSKNHKKNELLSQELLNESDLDFKAKSLQGAIKKIDLEIKKINQIKTTKTVDRAKFKLKLAKEKFVAEESLCDTYSVKIKKELDKRQILESKLDNLLQKRDQKVQEIERINREISDMSELNQLLEINKQKTIGKLGQYAAKHTRKPPKTIKNNLEGHIDNLYIDLYDNKREKLKNQISVISQNLSEYKIKQSKLLLKTQGPSFYYSLSFLVTLICISPILFYYF